MLLMHDQLIDQIRRAFADGADPAARGAGAQAARMLLAVLEAQPGQPMGAPAPSMPSPPPATSPAPASAPQHPVDHLLALLMEKLSPLLAQVPAAEQPAGFQVPFVPLPGFGR